MFNSVFVLQLVGQQCNSLSICDSRIKKPHVCGTRAHACFRRMADSKYGIWESYEGLTVHQRHPNLSERALQELLRQRYVLAENQTLGLFKHHVLRASVFTDKASPDAEKSLTRSRSMTDSSATPDSDTKASSCNQG